MLIRPEFIAEQPFSYRHQNFATTAMLKNPKSLYITPGMFLYPFADYPGSPLSPAGSKLPSQSIIRFLVLCKTFSGMITVESKLYVQTEDDAVFLRELRADGDHLEHKKLSLDELIGFNNFCNTTLFQNTLNPIILEQLNIHALNHEDKAHTCKSHTICVDLDGVLFDSEGITNPFDLDSYFTAPHNQNLVNELTELSDDYEIVVYSSRPPQAIGVTIDRLNEIELPWSEIVLGKVPCKVLIDDCAYFYNFNLAETNTLRIKEYLE